MRFEAWYEEKIKETGALLSFTESSAKKLQETVLQRFTGQGALLTIHQLSLVVGIVPPGDIPSTLVHSQSSLLSEHGLVSNFFFEGSKQHLTGTRYILSHAL